MSNGTRDFIKRFALQNLNFYIGSLMDSNCRKTESTPQDIADCKAVRSSSIHVAEDPDGFFDNSVRIAFETAGKEGWFGNYGSRQMSILFGQDGSFVKAELQNSHSFLLPNGGNIGVGCTAGVIRDIPTGDTASLDAGGNPDGGSETSDVTQPQSDASSDVCEADGPCMADISDVADDVPDVEDASTDSGLDLAGDVTDTDGLELPPDMSTNDASDAEDALQDAASDLSEDATAADGTELPPDMSVEVTILDAGADLADDATAADGVLPPEDASVDAAIQDAGADVADDVATPICQNFCDAGISETIADASSDVDLPADVTPAVVTSNLCGPITAPANSVAVACTNGPINVMLQGAASCVAECAFFDKTEITISADPNAANKFYKTFGDIQFGFFVPYEKITWTSFAPILSDNSPVALPSFMGSAYVYVFNKEKYDNTGTYVWETQDENGKFKKTDYLQLIYQPKDEFFNTTPEFLEQSHITSTGGLMTYRYPCDTLLNPQVQCTEVK